jgi:sugar O-acyltransferase (sialic acid O-acetyltransferase NeuD family)
MMTKKNILRLGARGHARAVADVIKAENRYQIAGLIDSFQEPGTICFGCKVMGGEKDVPTICDKLSIRHIFIAIGDNFQRQAMARRLFEAMPDVSFISTIHPSAVVGSDVEIGEGTVIMPKVVVVSGSRIAEGCLLNTAASLDHDSVMEAWSSLAPGVITGGHVHIGAGSAIGLGASIRDRITIGRDTVIGIGSVVTENMPENAIAYGAPCRVIRPRQPGEQYL